MYVVFDIGGTKTRIAITRDLHTIESITKFDTPALFDDAMQLYAQKIATLLPPGERIEAVAGGIRGPLNHEKTKIISETVLVDWVNKPLAAHLEDICVARVVIENDTALVGLGEAHVGAGKGYDIVAYHTVSTGVGGVRIVNGHIDVARSGFEPGKQIIDADHTLHADLTTEGTLESLISGEATERRFGKKPYEIAQSDPVWDELAYYLACGLKNTVLYWSPDALVLGGSMVIGDPRIMRDAIVRETEKLLKGLVPCPPILDATLKDEGGIHGACALLRQNAQNLN